MWVFFFNFFNIKNWPIFPQEKRAKITQIYTREKNKGIPKKIPNFFVQKMTKFVNNKLLAHITNQSFGIFTLLFCNLSEFLLKVVPCWSPLWTAVWFLIPSCSSSANSFFKKNRPKRANPAWNCGLVPYPPLVPHSQSHKKKGDQKGKTWHEIVVMVICRSTKKKKKKKKKRVKRWGGGGAPFF